MFPVDVSQVWDFSTILAKREIFMTSTIFVDTIEYENFKDIAKSSAIKVSCLGDVTKYLGGWKNEVLSQKNWKVKKFLDRMKDKEVLARGRIWCSFDSFNQVSAIPTWWFKIKWQKGVK